MNRSDAKVRSDHVLRCSVVNVGEDFIHQLIPFYGGQGILMLQTGVEVDEIVFCD